MLDKSYQSQSLLFLLLALLFNHIHSLNISLDDVTFLIASQTTKNSESCSHTIDKYNEERKAKFCGKQLLYSSGKTAFKTNETICLTGTKQNVFDRQAEQPVQLYINVSRCQTLHQKGANNVSSCEWLLEVYNKLEENKLLLSVIIDCNNATEDERQWCSTFNISSGDENARMDNCLMYPTPSMKSSEDFIHYMKKYMTPILAALGSVCFIIILVLANRVRKRYKCSGSRHPPESGPDMSNSNEDNLYHEPDNHHTYVEVDDSRSRNYEYAYGHLDVGTPRINAADIFEGSNPSCTNITPDKPDCEKDYVNDRSADKTYIEMENSYQALDRSSMVDDKALYQGLVQHKDRIRPKIAPKPRRDEKTVVSYVKVM